ncbi:MAG: AAA family ATPase [Corynebacterium sp.]|uniref:AAA family ATPase n=1 Tax=Corynebacterium sp. TaxID=1720 RepID=UPI0026E0B2F0|nr:AAA family ATPase [Corynebacterium sp.]MDO5668854.1 AAA family ATPase [Corynebacterium sp.]
MFLRAALLDAPPHPSWLRALPVVCALLQAPLEFTAPVTLISGENGAGKSTLVEALAVGSGFNAEGGSRHARMQVEDNSVSPLNEYLTLRRHNAPDGFFLRGESFFNLAQWYAGLDDSPLPDLLDMSHGQSIMSLVERRFHGGGLFILDEPEAGLSNLRQLELLGRLWHLADRGSQIIMATHSPILLALPGAQILEVDAMGIHERQLEDTEAFRAAREFVADPIGTTEYLTS